MSLRKKDDWDIALEEAQRNTTEIRRQQFNMLIFSVVRRFPGETRFQTALRYIREAESRACDGHPTKSRAGDVSPDNADETLYDYWVEAKKADELYQTELAEARAKKVVDPT